MSDIAALPPVSRSNTKWFAVGALAIAAAAFAFITVGGIGDNLVYYWGPSEVVAAGDKAIGATIRLVVAVDGGDDGVGEAHLLNRSGDAHRLQLVEDEGAPGLHGAEAAGAGAGVAEDHEGGGAGLPALAYVRAAGFLADGVKVLLAHQALEADVVVAAGEADLQPGGLAGCLLDGHIPILSQLASRESTEGTEETEGTEGAICSHKLG